MQSDYMCFNWWPRPGGQERVMARVSDEMVPMAADDHLDLPGLVHDDVKVDPQPDVLRDHQRQRLFRDIRIRTQRHDCQSGTSEKSCGDPAQQAIVFDVTA